MPCPVILSSAGRTNCSKVITAETGFPGSPKTRGPAAPASRRHDRASVASGPDRGDRLYRVLAGALRDKDISGLPDPFESVAWLTALALGLAAWIYTRREYESRSRD